jgi:hypothetical protein
LTSPNISSPLRMSVQITHPLDQHHMGKHHMDKALMDRVQMDKGITCPRASHAQGSHGPDSDGQDLQTDKAITWTRASHGHNSDRPDLQMDKGITWTRSQMQTLARCPRKCKLAIQNIWNICNKYDPHQFRNIMLINGNPLSDISQNFSKPRIRAGPRLMGIDGSPDLPIIVQRQVWHCCSHCTLLCVLYTAVATVLYCVLHCTLYGVLTVPYFTAVSAVSLQSTRQLCLPTQFSMEVQENM